MSDTEPDLDYNDLEVGFETEPTQSESPSAALDDIRQVLEHTEDAYNHTLGPGSLDAVNGFLYSVLQTKPAFRHREIRAFQQLVTKGFLDRLLRLRSNLRADGMRCSANLIDQIISQLGVLVLLVVKDSAEGKHIAQSESLKGQIERDCVRAASQLPDYWDAFPTALSSDHISPAAKRLIIRLLFGVLVMQPDLDQSKKPSSILDFSVVSSCLEATIEEYIQFDAVTGSPITFKDELDCAFFLCLYTTARMVLCQALPDAEDDGAIHKTRIKSHLLALIDRILYPDDDSSENPWVSRAAHAVCFGWGKLVPWSWSTWVDQRLADVKIVTTMTLRWLETIDCIMICSSHRRCALAMAHLSENVLASFVALSDTLVHGVNLLQEGRSNQSAIFNLLDQLSSFILPLFHEIIQGRNCSLSERLQAHASRACRSILLLCVMRPWELGNEPVVDFLRDNYLDILLSMDRNVIQQCLGELQTDRIVLFSSNLDRGTPRTISPFTRPSADITGVFTEAKGHLNDVLISRPHISMIRFGLGLLTILCSAGIRGIVLRENISSFFVRLYNRLIIGERCEEYGEMLLGPLVVALMTAEKHFHPARPFSSLTEDDEFWRLCLQRSTGNFHSSLALAQYIVHCTYPQSCLLLLETLDLFRTHVLNVLQDKRFRDSGDVFRLACPTFCLAMIQLLTRLGDGSRAVKYFFISSPWTKVLCRELKRMLEGSAEPGDERHYLRDTMGSTGALLLQVLSDNDAGLTMKLPNTKFLLYQSGIIAVTTE